MTTEELNQMLSGIEPGKVKKFINTMMKDEAQMAALQGKTQQEMIKLYIECVAKKDDKINAAYYHNPLGKKPEDCYKYIERQVKKLANGTNSAMVSSTIIFEMVEKYFLDDTIKKEEERKPAKAESKSKPQPQNKQSQEEKAKKWEAEHNQRIDAWETKQNAKIDQWDKQHRGELFYNPDENPHIHEKNPYLDEKNPYA